MLVTNYTANMDWYSQKPVYIVPVAGTFRYNDRYTVTNESHRCQFSGDAVSNHFFLGRCCVDRRTDRPKDFLAIRRSRG